MARKRSFMLFNSTPTNRVFNKEYNNTPPKKKSGSNNSTVKKEKPVIVQQKVTGTVAANKSIQYNKIQNTTVQKSGNVLVGCILKLENRYIGEWINHYKKLGVDKIIIYDNNDFNGENIYDVTEVSEGVKNGYIDVYDVRGEKRMQCKCYNNCYSKYNKYYRWIGFFDIDEFLMLDDFDNIYSFLSQEKFSTFDCVQFDWKIFDDNDLLSVKDGDYSVVKRFTRVSNAVDMQIKTFVRCGLNIKYTNPHIPNNISSCTVDGKKRVHSGPFVHNKNYNGACLNHYMTKTADEFRSFKMARGDAFSGGIRGDIKYFFKYNKRTDEKVKILSGNINLKYTKNISDIKVGLCAIAKNENLYIREWVEHYKKLGFYKIYLYDNNDLDGERFDEVIGDYINSGFVRIKDVRGEFSRQVSAYNEFYHNEGKCFDWVLYADIDEFLILDKKYNSSINKFVSDSIFDNYDCIKVCWKQFTDSNLLSVSGNNYSISRFTEYLPINKMWASNSTKALMRTKLKVNITSPHGPVKENIKSCNTLGTTCGNEINIRNNTWSNCCLNHYRFKTIEEYITNKMVKGWPTLYGNGGTDKMDLKFFFDFNKKTREKEEYAKKLLKTYNENKIFISSYVNFDNKSLKHNNWGDDINFYFLPKIMPYKFVPYRKLGVLINNTYKDKVNYMFIGSMINNRTVNEKTIIWGSGIINGSGNNINNLKKPLKVCAVRGPLTRQKLLERNIKCPEIYGDPALLLPYYYKKDVVKKHKLGIILHFHTKLNLYKFNNDDDIKIIDIKNYKKWTDFIDDVLSCENIVSESLHGLIVATAYKVPNLWVDVSLESKEKSKFKFLDFFASIGDKRKEPFKLTTNTTKNELLDKLKGYEYHFDIDLQKLIDACPLKINLTL